MTEGTADFLITIGLIISFLLVSSLVVVVVVFKELRVTRTQRRDVCNTEAPSP